MRVLVLGATGGTGREVARQAVAKGYSVAALVRPGSPTTGLDGIATVEGDARDEAALTRALDGCDAVASCLGTGVSPFRKVTLLSTATRALVDGMNRRDVRRLVCITGIGAGDSRGHGGFLYDRLIQPLLLRTVYQDKERQEAIIRASGLDWVIVRPSMLVDGPGRGRIQALTDLSGFHGGKIARSDVAAFVVEQLVAGAWLRQTPLVTW